MPEEINELEEKLKQLKEEKEIKRLADLETKKSAEDDKKYKSIVVKTALEVLKRIPKPKDGEQGVPGVPGKDAPEIDIKELEKRILSKVPPPTIIDTEKLERRILAKVPKIDLTSIHETLAQKIAFNDKAEKRVRKLEVETKNLYKQLSFNQTTTSYGGEVDKLSLLTSDVKITNPTNNDVLTYVTADGKWENKVASGSSPLTTKGDLYTFSTVNDRLPVGTNGYVLSVDSTQSTGLKWIVAGGSITGTDKQILFFDGNNNPAGVSSFTFDKTTQTITFGVDNGNAYIKTPNSVTLNFNASNFNFLGGDGLGSGAGSSVQFVGGTGGATGPGGGVEFDGGNGGVTSGNGGPINFAGGEALAGNGNGGSIFLFPGIKNGSGSDGAVSIGDSYSSLLASFNTSLLATSQTFSFPDQTGVFNVLTDRLSLTAQVADIADTAFSVRVAGLYKVSFYLLDTTADLTAGSVTLNIKFTDDAAARTISSSPVILTATTGFTQASIVVESVDGNITYGVTHTGAYNAATYALYLTLERLI